MASTVTLEYGIYITLAPQQQSGMGDTLDFFDSIDVSMANVMEIDSQLSDLLTLSDLLASDDGVDTIDSDDAMSLSDSTSFIEGTLSQFSDVFNLFDSLSHSDSRTNIVLVEVLGQLHETFALDEGIETLAFSEAMSQLDASSVASGIETVTLADVVSQSDAVSLLQSTVVNFTEVMSQSDAAIVTNSISLLFLTPSEALSQVDAVGIVLNAVTGFADSLAQSDSVSLDDGAFLFQLADNAAQLTDVFTLSQGIFQLMTVAEAMIQSDSAALRYAEMVSLADSTAQSDAISLVVLIAAAQLALSDALTLSDATVVATNLNITTTSLPTAAVGEAYSATLTAQGGVLPYTWSLVGSSVTNTVTGTGPLPQWKDLVELSLVGKSLSLTDSLRNYNDSVALQFYVGGILPPGLSLASNGTISGTPTEAATFDFTVQVQDSSNMMMLLHVRMAL